METGRFRGMAHQEVATICVRDCPDACSIIATVDQGRVISQRGDPDHGVTRGFLIAEKLVQYRACWRTCPRRLLWPCIRRRWLAWAWPTASASW
jgi:anaerobic selenocysteine-containing dehydrogenase